MNILHEFFKKITRELLRDRETMKSLSPSQRLRFIFDYYRGRIFLLLCLCLAVFYVWDAACQASRQTVLEGFFTNDDAGLFPAQDIARDFSEILVLNSRQQVIFDDSLYVVPGSSADYHTASQSKIVAYVAARELDFLVTTPELTEYYAASLPVYDLKDLMPPELFARLEDQIYYATDAAGSRKACAVSMAKSRFQKGTASEDAAPHYLMAFSYTEHQDTIIRFLEYAFPAPS